MPLHLATFFYDPDPSFGHGPRTFVTLMLVGFVIGIGGHIFGSKRPSGSRSSSWRPSSSPWLPTSSTHEEMAR
jgi:hypothetical protein